jgi:hypothetical protein
MTAMTQLRTLLLAAGLCLAALSVAHAQNPVSILESTAPVAIGDQVRGMVLYPMGTTGIGTVEVVGYYADDVTTYWRGSYMGGEYVYDTYSGFWKPTPVSYEPANLEFQGSQLEGWTRSFGGRLDRNVFIGRDGDVYKRVNITKKQRRGKRSRTRVMYTYFLNLSTFERSDGQFMPYYGMTEADQQYVKDQSAAAESVLADQAASNPAFPRWDGKGEQPAPEIVSLPNGTQTESLADLIEEQVGPIQEGAPTQKN